MINLALNHYALEDATVQINKSSQLSVQKRSKNKGSAAPKFLFE